ncbi:hypothetical protein DM02DRAFT_243248 [Periconia macrospinosa]|uniref:Uncharacterized protein n=1 Tax=Periconia macrospinosa TaxID=97972 RepID=A0A2V1D7J4_9PLEO|nr:hypothetical protein DM02DRAFT_243248 [Periconia macrospinosa]
MDQNVINMLMSSVESIRTALDTSPDSWREHTQAIRNMMASLEFRDTSPDDSRKEWQVSVITVFQRVAHADVDHGGSVVLDIADWCLKQSVVLIQLYPDDVALLALIGENWLLRAQQPLINIHHAEQSSVSSGDSQNATLSCPERQARAQNAALEAKQRLDTADYVEARTLLLPAVEYLKRAVDAAHAQDKIYGALLVKVR